MSTPITPIRLTTYYRATYENIFRREFVQCEAWHYADRNLEIVSCDEMLKKLAKMDPNQKIIDAGAAQSTTRSTIWQLVPFFHKAPRISTFFHTDGERLSAQDFMKTIQEVQKTS